MHLAKCVERGTCHFPVLRDVRLDEHTILRTQELRAELTRLNQESLYTERCDLLIKCVCGVYTGLDYHSDKTE